MYDSDGIDRYQRARHKDEKEAEECCINGIQDYVKLTSCLTQGISRMRSSHGVNSKSEKIASREHDFEIRSPERLCC